MRRVCATNPVESEREQTPTSRAIETSTRRQMEMTSRIPSHRERCPGYGVLVEDRQFFACVRLHTVHATRFGISNAACSTKLKAFVSRAEQCAELEASPYISEWSKTDPTPSNVVPNSSHDRHVCAFVPHMHAQIGQKDTRKREMTMIFQSSKASSVNYLV